VSDSSVPEEQEWCSEHYQYNCTELSHGVSELPTLEEVKDITDLFLGDASFSTAEFVAPEEIKDLPPEQITDDLPPMEDIQIGDGSCVVCGAATFRPPGLTKAGHKKRAPKYCDLHNPKLRVSGERSFSPGMEGIAQLQKIQDELADDLRLLAVMAGPLLPVTGMYVFENADPFTTALLKLCKNNPRALRVLHRAASVAPVYEVAKDCAGVFYAIQVDMKKLEPHNTVSQRLGVARAYDTVYPESTNGNGTSVMNNGVQGPPRYATQ
jgi:hypothetical protein